MSTISTKKVQFKLPSEARLKESLELVELGQKARMVFHDLSNHLTALTLSIGHLEENLVRDVERLREYSKQSERARQQMEQVAGLLKTYIASDTKTALKPAEEISQLISTFHNQAKEQNVQLTTSLSPDAEIVCRKSDFLHVVGNLLTNALDSFNEVKDDRERKIIVSLENSSKELTITVTDTGCGISKNNLSKIFTPGFTTKPTNGGMGLYLVKECVEQDLSGTISVKSTVFGTRFTVSIPKKETKQKRKPERFPFLLPTPRNFVSLQKP